MHINKVEEAIFKVNPLYVSPYDQIWDPFQKIMNILEEYKSGTSMNMIRLVEETTKKKKEDHMAIIQSRLAQSVSQHPFVQPIETKVPMAQTLIEYSTEIGGGYYGGTLY